MFDFTIFSSFSPKGLLLAESLSEKGRKVCYIDLQQEDLPPCGIFINESDSELKLFLESLGHLLSQKEGFCLLSPKGHWSFQELDWKNMSLSVFRNFKEKTLGDFQDHWLSFLSRNLMSRVIEGNGETFFQKKLDFFSDYFLFESSSKKQKQFQMKNSNIVFLQASIKDIQIQKQKKKISFSLHGEIKKSDRVIWLANEQDFFKLYSPKKTKKPDWKWTRYSFDGDLKDYKDIVPSHFVSLKNLSLPWTHDNLLSVFRANNRWDVWLREPRKKEDQDLSKSVLVHLKNTFKKYVDFKFIQKEELTSFFVYESKELQQKWSLPENLLLPSLSQLPHGDLLSQFQYEKNVLEHQGDFFV